MKLTFDPRYNIAYIALRDKTAQVTTLKLSEDLHIDIGPDGKLYGIELLNAVEQLASDDNHTLTVINSAVNSEQHIPLSW